MYTGFFARGELDSIYFSTSIVCFAFLWFCDLFLLGSVSLNVFIYVTEFEKKTRALMVTKMKIELLISVVVLTFLNRMVLVGDQIAQHSQATGN